MELSIKDIINSHDICHKRFKENDRVKRTDCDMTGFANKTFTLEQVNKAVLSSQSALFVKKSSKESR